METVRRAFLVLLHSDERRVVVEDLRTSERTAVRNLADVARQLEIWASKRIPPRTGDG